MTAQLTVLYCHRFLRLLKARLWLWRLRDNSRNPSGGFCATNSPESCLEGTPRGSLKRRAGGSAGRVVPDRRVGSPRLRLATLPHAGGHARHPAPGPAPSARPAPQRALPPARAPGPGAASLAARRHLTLCYFLCVGRMERKNPEPSRLRPQRGGHGLSRGSPP